MAQLQYAQGVLKELRQPQPGKDKYWLVLDVGGRQMGFSIWPDAEFLNTVPFQVGSPYQVSYEMRGKYLTAREVTPAAPGMAPPAQAGPMTPVAYAAPPMPYPVVQTAPAPPMPMPMPVAPARTYQAPIDDTSLHIFVTGIVGRWGQSGQFSIDDMELLSRAAVRCFSMIPNLVTEMQQMLAAPPTGNEPPPYEDYPQ